MAKSKSKQQVNSVVTEASSKHNDADSSTVNYSCDNCSNRDCATRNTESGASQSDMPRIQPIFLAGVCLTPRGLEMSIMPPNTPNLDALILQVTQQDSSTVWGSIPKLLRDLADGIDNMFGKIISTSPKKIICS